MILPDGWCLTAMLWLRLTDSRRVFGSLWRCWLEPPIVLTHLVFKSSCFWIYTNLKWLGIDIYIYLYINDHQFSNDHIQLSSTITNSHSNSPVFFFDTSCFLRPARYIPCPSQQCQLEISRRPGKILGIYPAWLCQQFANWKPWPFWTRGFTQLENGDFSSSLC